MNIAFGDDLVVPVCVMQMPCGNDKPDLDAAFSLDSQLCCHPAESRSRGLCLKSMNQHGQ